MEWQTIQRDNRKTRKLFIRYFNHEWAKNILKKKRWLAVYPLSVVLLVMNLLTPHELDDYNYYFFRFCLITILAYLPVLYVLQFIKLMIAVNEITSDTQPEFEFRFDENGFFYRDNVDKMEEPWSEFSHFSVNKTDVYLYNSKGRLRHLVSKDVIGSRNFNRVIEMVESRLERRYSE